VTDGRRRSEKRSARIVQDATGAIYTWCLQRVRELRAMGNGALDAYLDRCEAIPDADVGTRDRPRCLQCLEVREPGHACTAGVD